ncbi:hypothetical protein [Deinococcus detaillensis]|uniref:hypothetical protein n=1 Tax=Deinococcus detaillensis TaxID=2592048 RepID=UPI00163D94BA|nr:hypothetical protein [Deinococcus detaillensis]
MSRQPSVLGDLAFLPRSTLPQQMLAPQGRSALLASRLVARVLFFTVSPVSGEAL